MEQEVRSHCKECCGSDIAVCFSCNDSRGYSWWRRHLYFPFPQEPMTSCLWVISYQSPMRLHLILRAAHRPILWCCGCCLFTAYCLLSFSSSRSHLLLSKFLLLPLRPCSTFSHLWMPHLCSRSWFFFSLHLIPLFLGGQQPTVLFLLIASVHPHNLHCFLSVFSLLQAFPHIINFSSHTAASISLHTFTTAPSFRPVLVLHPYAFLSGKLFWSLCPKPCGLFRS